MEDIVVQKKNLRKEIIEGRRQLSVEEVNEKSLSIASKVISLEAFKKANTVMLYMDFNNEVKTEELIKEALQQGKRVFSPITDVKNKQLIPTEIKHYPEDLVAGVWGILEPKKEGYVASPEEFDLIIVPGVAFDKKGNRLGYGGGFYDRFLPKTKSGTFFVAVAYELQIKDNVYAESHDQPVHYIITEERVIKNT